MTTIVQELRGVLARRIETAPQSEVLSILTALCAPEAPAVNTIVGKIGPRFMKHGPAGSDDWNAVEDRETGLIWARAPLPGKRRNWEAAKKDAAALNLCGWTDWRLPTIEELLTLEIGRAHV